MAPKGASSALKRAGRWSGVLISVVLLALIARKAHDFGAAKQALAAADYRWVLAGALLYLATFLPRGLRWGRLLGGVRAIPLPHLCEVLIIGFMANNVLPFRLGEFVRAYTLGRKAQVSPTAAFGTIVMERVADGLTLVLALAVVSLAYPFPVWVKRLGIVTAVLFVGVTAFLVLLAYQRAVARRIVRLVTRVLPAAFAAKAEGLLDQFDQGLHLLRSPLDAVAVFCLTIVIWAMEFGVHTRVLAAFAAPITAALGHPVPLHDILLMLIVLNFGIMVPSGPAYLGTFQAAVIAVLAGVVLLPEPLAFSISWVLWATLVLPTVLLGFLFMASEQLSFGSLAASRRQQAAPSEVAPVLPTAEWHEGAAS